MTEGSSARPLFLDFFRPRCLFEKLRARPSFVLPALVLTAAFFLYVEVTARSALPLVVPALLDRAAVTESELRTTFLRALRATAVIGPLLALPATAFAAWLALDLARARRPFRRVLAVVAWAGGWIALGFAAKTLVAQATGRADPAMNVGAFVTLSGALPRYLAALTNPFGILAIVWTVLGLRALDVPKLAAAIAGGGPWAAWLVGLALLFGGPERFAPSEPVSLEGWTTVTRGPITVRCPPALGSDGEHLAVALARFTEHLGEQLSFEPAALRVYVYPDHATLERAAGERLHALVTGSIRGSDLLYIEAPGRSPAVPRERGLREALRYVGTVELAPSAKGSPRWFVEGFVHASVYPGDVELARQFRAALKSRGIPPYERLLDPSFLRTPEGPLFARSLVDHIAFLNGRDAPEKIMRDLTAGTSFRDALFSVTRLTTSALEEGWIDALKTVTGGAPARPDSATARIGEVVPFREGP